VRSGGRWAVIALLLAGVVYAWPTYVRYFGLHPKPMAAALLVAGSRLVPKVSMRDGIVLGALGGLGFAIVEFAAMFATSGYVEQGWAYLRTAIPARWALGTDSHIVWGATAGAGVGYLLNHRGRALSVLLALGIVVLVMATHGLNDLYGKIIGPLAIELLIGPAQRVGVDLATIAEGSPLIPLLLVYGAVMSTLLMNLLLWPVLIWGLWYSGRADRGLQEPRQQEAEVRSQGIA
jgi:hypothetical protein